MMHLLSIIPTQPVRKPLEVEGDPDIQTCFSDPASRSPFCLASVPQKKYVTATSLGGKRSLFGMPGQSAASKGFFQRRSSSATILWRLRSALLL